jgi:hypothetical protein
MVSKLFSSALDRGFERRSGHFCIARNMQQITSQLSVSFQNNKGPDGSIMSINESSYYITVPAA